MENKQEQGSILDNIKTMFRRRDPIDSGASADDAPDSPTPISGLSQLANSVVARCSKILKMSTEEIQTSFDAEMPGNFKQRTNYARNLLEFCSYGTINSMTARSDYLSNKEFRRLTYDMMLAWESPDTESTQTDGESMHKDTASHDQGGQDEDGWSLFHTNSTAMAVQVDDEKTVGPEAFSRIACACAAIADVITAQNLFHALTGSSGNRLHFLVYDKYLQNLDKSIKSGKNLSVTSSTLQLVEGEIVIDADGTPIQPVLQHIGISAWPGRLTLTSHALYFESGGVGLYDKPVRYDLSTDIKQVVKPELTGPLGARLFDKAVMYQSTATPEPVYLEFPELKGSSRRDYWLDVCLEILHVHRFVRQYNLKGIQQSEAIARAVLGIFRFHAVKEALCILSSQYKTLLPFHLAESLPGGDIILETLSSQLALMNASVQRNPSGHIDAKKQIAYPVSVLTLNKYELSEDADNVGQESYPGGYVSVGETDLLESVVRRSILDTGRAEAAQATIDRVKVDGIDTNLAVMKELLFPLILAADHFQHLTSWEEPLKSSVFLVLMSYIVLSGWVAYVLPSILVFLAVIMLWRRHFNKGKPVKPFKIVSPPYKNAVEQLMTLQEAISQVEALIQAGNVILLKLRALLLAVLPQATDRVAMVLIILAVVFTLLPLPWIILMAVIEVYTREMPLRRESSYRWIRRVREWWFRVPAAPVQLIKPEESKKRK